MTFLRFLKPEKINKNRNDLQILRNIVIYENYFLNKNEKLEIKKINEVLQISDDFISSCEIIYVFKELHTLDV